MKSMCEKCQVEIQCQQSTSCWCASFPTILSPEKNQTCLCKSCLKEVIIKRTKDLIDQENYTFIKSLGVPELPMEGIDFYYNNAGLLVMTQWYHLRRGFCCKNACLHCAYNDE